MGLSQIDAKLLRFAIQNGIHFSDKAIAERLRLSPSTVNYSLHKLVKENVIQGFRYKLDYRRLGLDALAWVIFPLKKGLGRRGEVLKQFLLYPEVHVASFITGERDVALKVIARNHLELNQVVLDISGKFAKNIPLVFFSTQQFKAHNVCVEPNPKPIKIDAKDLALIDSRMVAPDKPLKEIAKELGVHKNTILRRWHELFKEKVVLKKSLRLNPEHFGEAGIALKAIVFFDVHPNYREDFIKQMCSLPEVHELHSLLSVHDFLSIIRLGDIAEFYAFLSKVAAGEKFGINSIVTEIFLKIESHAPNYLSELERQGTISF